VTPRLEGVKVRLRRHNRPADRRRGMPPVVFWGVAIASVFYVVAHLAIVVGVWPVHGTAPGAGATLVRDGIALLAWLALLLVLRRSGYRGSWAVVALPVMIFLFARPALFHTFTDPAYQATRETRAEANAAKAERSRLSTILRAYDADRQRLVFDGEPPELPSPLREAAYEAPGETLGILARLASYGSPFLAPVAILFGFLLARRPEHLRLLREKRMIPFALTLGVFFILTLFFTELGRVAGTTPWELFLPVFVLVWAAVLADDSYNFGRMGAAFHPRRLGPMLAYGALPLVPFLLIRELGLSVVLAGTLAAMLLVGTRRGWWAGLMVFVWTVLVAAAFSLDDRSATRLALAYDPYHDPAEMTAEEAEGWALRLHQFKLFDANVLAGGVFGAGPGQGHGETAPNAADDGYATLFASQYGIAGSASLVALYLLFLLVMLGIAIRERGAFERSAVTGLALLIAIPFWMAFLGGIRVVPLTGVAAAFAGHGGAKLLASALSVGIIAAISDRRGREMARDRQTASGGQW
jgi:cell division protein FtsW (lipid II flippase)